VNPFHLSKARQQSTIETKPNVSLQSSISTSYQTLPKEWTFLSQNYNPVLKSPVPPSIDRSIDELITRCACATIHLGHSNRSRTSARESLNSHNLEVEVLVGEAVLGPSVEVSSSVDSAGGTLALPDGPVLGESGGAGDGGLVGAGVGALHVGRAVDGDGAELGHAGGAGVEAAVAVKRFVREFVFFFGGCLIDDLRFDDVVLSLRVVDPAVDGEVGAAGAGRVLAGVGDGSGGTGLPAEAGNDIGAAVPLQGVLASAEVRLVASGSTVVVLVVVDSTRVALLDGEGLGSILDGSSESTKAANQSDESSRELHVC
jgi:hypothetical protein